MRILFLTNHTYLPERAGGSEQSTHEMALTLQQLGDQVAVLSRLGRWKSWTGLRGRLCDAAGYFPRDRRLGYLVYRSRALQRDLLGVINHVRPDVAVVQAGKPLEIAEALSKLSVPTVVHLRDLQFDELGGDPRCDPAIRFIANSKFPAEAFQRKFPIPARVIHNIVLREQYMTERSGNLVTFVNPNPKKGLELAFQVAEQLPQIGFQFVEGWPMDSETRRTLQSRAAAAGNIAWRRRTRDMRDIYRRTRVLLVPSQWEEAWGRVVTEAQISGIPVLASNRGGLPESVGPGGLLLPHDDLAQWCQVVEDVWCNETTWQRLAERAMEHSRRADLDPAILVSAYREVLDQVVQSGRRADAA